MGVGPATCRGKDELPAQWQIDDDASIIGEISGAFLGTTSGGLRVCDIQERAEIRAKMRLVGTRLADGIEKDEESSQYASRLVAKEAKGGRRGKIAEFSAETELLEGRQTTDVKI